MNPCGCESCRFTAKVFRIQRKLSERDAAMIEELLHRWAHESTDRAYYQAHLDGTWLTPTHR